MVTNWLQFKAVITSELERSNLNTDEKKHDVKLHKFIKHIQNFLRQSQICSKIVNTFYTLNV